MSDLRKVLHGRVHENSPLTKALFWAVNFIAVVVAVWLTNESLNSLRVKATLFTVALYFVRHGVTLFYLLQRKVPLDEVVVVGSFLLLWVPASAYLSTKAAPASIGQIVIPLSLVLFGSFLNSYSEIQRKWWKAKPENKGKCFTEGLWSYVVHINYTGDVILFTGWTLLTGYYATLVLPALMAYNFSYIQGPELDAYLKERYKEQFTDYLSTTGYLLPRLEHVKSLTKPLGKLVLNIPAKAARMFHSATQGLRSLKRNKTN